MTEVAERIPVTDGLSLHGLRREGSGAGFILVHGLASNARLWDGVAAELEAQGYPSLAIDQRGHGRSDKPAPPEDPSAFDSPFTMERVTDDLLSVVSASGFDRPILVGQSWGGNVVVEFAERFPGASRGIVAVDGGAIDLSDSIGDWAEVEVLLAPPRLVGTPVVRMREYLEHAHPDWPASGIEGTLANFEIREDGTVAPWLDFDSHIAVLRGLWEHHPLNILGAINDPVLFLLAGEPNETRTAEIASRLNWGGVEWMDGSHDLHAQFPREVAEILIRFAAEIEQR
jgi:pimeloyl-ACP methyl ester carboxylesterase